MYIPLSTNIQINCTRLEIGMHGYLGDSCIAFENFTASIGDLMVGN
jgi:hypothetical protein